MRVKTLMGTAVLAAFLTGSIFGGYLRSQLSKSSTPPDDTVTASSASNTAHGVSQSRVVYRDAPKARRHHRSRDREILIVAGSAGAGTAIGALAGGKKGAGIGALSGGLAGLAYDLATRNR